MIQETVIPTTTPFDGEAQTTKFWQDPKTGQVKTVPVDWEPEEVIEITLTEKEIRRREGLAYDSGRKEGYEEGHRVGHAAGYAKATEEAEKKEKKTK